MKKKFGKTKTIKLITILEFIRKKLKLFEIGSYTLYAREVEYIK